LVPWSCQALRGFFISPRQARKAHPVRLVLIFLNFLFSLQRLARGFKVLSTSTDILNRRNNMITNYLVLGITLVYAVTELILYLKSEKPILRAIQIKNEPPDIENH
jgi:hypothetical protein